jgi:hypothetical protein
MLRRRWRFATECRDGSGEVADFPLPREGEVGAKRRVRV